MDKEGRKKLIREIVVLLAGSALFFYIFNLGYDYLYIPLVIGLTGLEIIITVQTYRISILISGSVFQIIWAVAFLLMLVITWWWYPPSPSPVIRYYD